MRIWIWFFSFFILSLFIHYPKGAIAIASSRNSSHIGECNALLQFGNSLSISKDASEAYCNRRSSITSYPKTASWKKGTDCCSWDGVTCYNATNDVIGLDLSCSWLQGPLLSNSTLFSLSSLRGLNLAGNSFNFSDISPKFGIFTGMTHLNLSGSRFAGPVPLETISHLSSLITLDLSSSYGGMRVIEDDSFKWLVRNLTQLKELVLDYVDMSGISPSSLVNLSSSLTSLSLVDCSLQGIFPIDIFLLPNLLSLSLSWNTDLTGSLPQTNWTGPLVSLDLIETGFRGSIPASVGNLTHMSSLNLFNSMFTGPIPPTLGNLNRLTNLVVSHNHLSGTVDIELFVRLKDLENLSLRGNNLTVLLPSNGNCSFPKLKGLFLSECNLTKFPYFLNSSVELSDLDLSGNTISGRIPGWFWRVGRDTLRNLDLSDNKITGPLPVPPPSTVTFYAWGNNFTGEIPSSICQVNSLGELFLSNNSLSGTIPGCLGDLSNLSRLYLNDNLLRGPLPQSLANCTSLQDLDVSHNGIEDTFPNWLNATGSLGTLNLQSNKFYGVIEIPLPRLLYSTDLSNNNFSGQLPINFSLNSEAKFIGLANNSFEGLLPIPPPTTEYYLISNNKFDGGIPRQICNATELRIIDLSNNRLTSTIPQCFINFNASLSVLDLRNNRFVGQIPEIFIPMTILQTIRLSQNRLQGTVPQSVARCEDLEVLDLSENELEGRFPYWLETLPSLQVLVLRSNKFSGPVDHFKRTDHPFPKLTILDLSKNGFSGPLPAKFIASLIAMKDGERQDLQYIGGENQLYQDSITVVMKHNEIELVRILTVFTTIDFSSNLFEGEIPEVIGDLKALKGLNFSHNNLTAKIPSTIGNLTNLEWLDLSSNKLNGNIPSGLADLTSLSSLNLSNNNLIGSIPRGTQFDTFDHSFDGNPSLCGRPLPKACESDAGKRVPTTSHAEEATESDNGIEWRAVPMGYGCGLAFGISAGYIMLETRRPRWLAKMVEWKRRRKTNCLKRNISPGNHGRRRTR